jgi:hypothetical protein
MMEKKEFVSGTGCTVVAGVTVGPPGVGVMVGVAVGPPGVGVYVGKGVTVGVITGVDTVPPPQPVINASTIDNKMR